MKIVCIESILEFEKDQEYSIEDISRYIVGNVQVFVQNYFAENIQIDVNIVNTFLQNFKIIS